MNKWNALVGRITLFPAVEAARSLPSAFRLYSSIWGGDPENFQKPANPLMPSSAMGRNGKISVGCAVHSSRIDFNLSPPSEHSGTPPESPLQMIEDTDELQSELLRIIEKIHQGVGIQPIVRVALAVQFAIVQDSFKEANAALRKFIPEEYRPNLTDEEDFIFQVNKPVTINESAGLRLNFITKWSVERLMVHRFFVHGPQDNLLRMGRPVIHKPEIHEIKIASIGFDNNNMPITLDGSEQPRALELEEQFSVLTTGFLATAKMQNDLQLDGPRF